MVDEVKRARGGLHSVVTLGSPPRYRRGVGQWPHRQLQRYYLVHRILGGPHDARHGQRD